jgi:hypothetical protein
MCFAVLAHDLLFRIIQIKWSQFTRCRVNEICIIRVAQSLLSDEIVVSNTEAVDRYPLLKLHISTEP